MSEGFFDKGFRLEELERCGDPLVKLNELVPWEEFRPELEVLRKSVEERKSPAGRKAFDVVLMFKIMILQSLYNLSDAAVEFQVKDRFSFMRFLNLNLADRIPDEKTIWAFREQLGKLGLESKFFEKFDGYLRSNGFSARKGQIVDASMQEKNLVVRTIGLVRETVKIGLRNLAYNLDRYANFMEIERTKAMLKT